jgi:predicted MFS family arabinose efflux permease
MASIRHIPLSVILLAGVVIMFIVLGIRQTFGLFLNPISADFGGGREVYAFAIGLQQIMWGVMQPVAGMIADKYGPGRVIAVGGVLFAAGLYVMSESTTSGALNLGGGFMIGSAMGAITFSVVLGAVGRMVPDEKRTMALSIVAGGCALGQVAMVPAALGLLDEWGWRGALVLLALASGLIVPCAAAFSGRPRTAPVEIQTMTLTAALTEAARHKGYWLLSLGFIACGFQITFVITHLPAHMADAGLPPSAAGSALMLLGVVNIVGNYIMGYMGTRWRKKYVLSGAYVLRSVVTTWYLATPVSETSTLIFIGIFGLTFLGTVPMTGALVADIFGPRYMTSLFSIVYLMHQLAAFVGVWMGGVVFDATGSYDIMWEIAIAVGVLAAILHLPIPDTPLRPTAAAKPPA